MDPKSKKTEITPEDVLGEISKIQKEIQDARIHSWNETLPTIERILDESSYTKDPILRKTYIEFLKRIWLSGYHSGGTNMATMVARDLGMGPMVDMLQVMKDQIRHDPSQN